MSSEPVYLILDIGSRSIRCGIAGHELPFVTIPNNGYSRTSRNPQFLQLNDHTLNANQLDDLINKSTPTIKELIRVYKDSLRNWMNRVEELRLHENLLETFLYISLVLGNCKVIIIDGGISQLNKLLICKILLIKIGLRSVQFIPSEILTTISANTPNGLVVELNWNLVRVCSIVDHRIAAVVESDSNLSGENLHYQISLRLLEQNHPVTRDIGMFGIVDYYIRNHAFVGEPSDETVTIEGYTFPVSLANDCIRSSMPSLVEQIIKTLKLSNIDTFLVLKRSIIFDGGISNIPGLKSAVLRSLREEMGAEDLKALKCLGVWQGGSIYCSVSIQKRSRSIRKTQEITKDTIRGSIHETGFQINKLPDQLNYLKYSM